MFAAAPLLVLPVLGYNLLVFILIPGGRHGSAATRLGETLVTFPTASGGGWSVTFGDLIVFVSLLVLFVELLKSTENHQAAVINHSLSMVLFIGCLVEFLLFRAFTNTAFFLLTVMVLLDVLAGFIVMLRREGGGR